MNTNIKYNKLLDLLYKFPNVTEKVKLNYCNLLSITEMDTIIFLEKVKSIHRNGGIIVAYVNEPESDTFDIIGSAKIFIETKIIENYNGFVGHIEDIIVKQEYQLTNVDRILLEEIKHIALERNCYKCVLNSFNEESQALYIKSGFKEKGLHLEYNF